MSDAVFGLLPVVLIDTQHHYWTLGRIRQCPDQPRRWLWTWAEGGDVWDEVLQKI
ncbi:hypothetical protein [Actinoplanes awajinensis]|uniref:hypothetical protein n=1 Tax=Actinoplanes awajinensis TaxID=135946 RepID=UPI0012F99BD4|nr:hypothetical protein [Actinoplanes awajinensis]